MWITIYIPFVCGKWRIQDFPDGEAATKGVANLLLPPANEGYVFTGVCLSTGWVWYNWDQKQEFDNSEDFCNY